MTDMSCVPLELELVISWNPSAAADTRTICPTMPVEENTSSDARGQRLVKLSKICSADLLASDVPAERQPQPNFHTSDKCQVTRCSVLTRLAHEGSCSSRRDVSCIGGTAMKPTIRRQSTVLAGACADHFMISRTNDDALSEDQNRVREMWILCLSMLRVHRRTSSFGIRGRVAWSAPIQDDAT